MNWFYMKSTFAQAGADVGFDQVERAKYKLYRCQGGMKDQAIHTQMGFFMNPIYMASGFLACTSRHVPDMARAAGDVKGLVLRGTRDKGYSISMKNREVNRG